MTKYSQYGNIVLKRKVRKDDPCIDFDSVDSSNDGDLPARMAAGVMSTSGKRGSMAPKSSEWKALKVKAEAAKKAAGAQTAADRVYAMLAFQYKPLEKALAKAVGKEAWSVFEAMPAAKKIAVLDRMAGSMGL